MDLREIGWGVWSGLTRLRIGTAGRFLWKRWWTLGFWLHRVSYLRLSFPSGVSFCPGTSLFMHFPSLLMSMLSCI
jgi:hypothetical protein